MAKSAKKITKAKITEKMFDGAYADLTSVKRAVAHSDMPPKARTHFLKVATNFFDKDAVKAAREKLGFSKKEGAATRKADPRFARNIPIHVQFGRLSHDKVAYDSILQFSRTALDAGLTLPELVS